MDGNRKGVHSLTVSLFIFAILLLYVYGGYLFLLKFFYLLKISSPSKTWTNFKKDELPFVSIYFSAYNEEETVENRLMNLMAQDYPSQKIEIIVLSDGSSDKTVEIVQNIASENADYDIRVVEYLDNKGQARAQNEVAKLSKHDILVSTDADSEFDSLLLRNIVQPFSDPSVGVVGAVVIYQSSGSAIGDSYSKYRNIEFQIRKYESFLGIGVKTDGPCLAYRKTFWKEINEWEDVDQVICLFAQQNGYRTIQADNAICYDTANKSHRQEIKQRSRMTRKALFSTFGRWGLKDAVKFPYFTFALFSHKIIRFFSPIFLLGLIVSFFGSCLGVRLITGVFLFITALALTIGISLFWLKRPDLSEKFVKIIYSFFVANLGFLLGLIQWGGRDRSGKYKPTRLY
jgi:cellulose synthase/poly-beta-1,6-N-acetylglucosamine synthase-like glycosyltransferase